MVLKKNNLLTVLPYIGREFKISFDILVSKFGPGWQSVIHFTTDGNHGIYGYRIPGLWVFQDKTLSIRSALNGNEHVYTHQPVLEVEKWINVEISQILFENKARQIEGIRIFDQLNLKRK